MRHVGSFSLMPSVMSRSHTLSVRLLYSGGSSLAKEQLNPCAAWHGIHTAWNGWMEIVHKKAHRHGRHDCEKFPTIFLPPTCARLGALSNAHSHLLCPSHSYPSISASLDPSCSFNIPTPFDEL